MKLELQQVSNVKGDIRRPFLALDAVVSITSVEVDTDGLVYTEMWRDGIESLLHRRTNGSSLVGYSPHNFGIAVDLDVETILQQKKIRYEDLLWLMKRRGWYCFRRDGVQDQAGSGHFNFLGEDAEMCLMKASQDPTTWQTVAEFRIWSRHHQDFHLEVKEVQTKLSKLGLFTRPATGNIDMYTREAIQAFQRAWDLTQTGSPDMTLCRALAFVTADVQYYLTVPTER